MAFPTVQDTTVTTTTTSAPSGSATMPATINAGELLMFEMGTGAATSTPSAGWTTVGTNTSTITGVTFAKVAAGGDTLTVTYGGGNAQMFGVMYRVANWSGTISDIKWAAVNSLDPPSLVAAANADNLWIATGITFSANAVTAPTSYTNMVASGTSLYTARRQLTAGTEDPGAFTQTSPVIPQSHTISVAPAARWASAMMPFFGL